MSVTLDELLAQHRKDMNCDGECEGCNKHKSSKTATDVSKTLHEACQLIGDTFLMVAEAMPQEVSQVLAISIAAKFLDISTFNTILPNIKETALVFSRNRTSANISDKRIQDAINYIANYKGG